MGKSPQRRLAQQRGAGPKAKQILDEAATKLDNKPTLTATFEVIDDAGTVLRTIERVVTWGEMKQKPLDPGVKAFHDAATSGPPDWLENGAKDWPHPQSGIMLTGRVHVDNVLSAVEWLGLPDESEG